MKLKNFIYLIAASAVLQGCATPGLDYSQLPIYPDNRVGYTLTTQSSSDTTRVWTDGKTVLALRFGQRLINAKDIESVAVRETRKPYVPLHIDVRLKSNESLVADVAHWGNSQYSNILVEWLACTPNRVCEYLDRKPSLKGMISFENTPNFLISIRESQLGRAGAGNVQDLFGYRTDAALPSSDRYARMNFADVDKVSDLREGLEAARKERERVSKCMADAYSAEERSRKMTEEQIIRETPPAQVQQRLAAWRATLRTGFAQTITLEMRCK